MKKKKKKERKAKERRRNRSPEANILEATATLLPTVLQKKSGQEGICHLLQLALYYCLDHFHISATHHYSCSGLVAQSVEQR